MARRKKSNEDEPNDNVNESDDNFGLPDIEYEPLNRDIVQEENLPIEENEIQSSHPEDFDNLDPDPIDDFDLDDNSPYQDIEDEPSSVMPKVIGIIAVLAIVAGAAWFFMVYQPKKKIADEKARQELALQKEAADKLKKEEELNAQLKQQQEEQRRADSLANLAPKEGSIEELTGRTGRYYVVVASALDDDLIMDYAKKLKDKGVSCKIIPKPSRGRFYHLAVADGATYADAQGTADGIKSQYGDGAWVIKY